MVKYTDDGSCVVYIKKDSKGKPIKITFNESELKVPYQVQYIKVDKYE